ncbi:MAG TPA: hypothetical protein VJ753_08045 [Rhizomicrobium sp.]|nr:hypothetical protein [Rhizomicrobium sp.]
MVSFRAFSGYFAFGGNTIAVTDVCSSVVQPVFSKVQIAGGIGRRAMESKMKKFAKFAFGALMVVGAATATTALTTTPAEARVDVEFSFGGPGYYGGYYGPRYYGPAYYDPYYDPYYYRPHYYGPRYYRGYHGGHGWRGRHHGGWHGRGHWR